MKSNKESLEIILDIEKNVAVDQIEYKGMKIWPLIRLEIWKKLTNSEQPKQSKGKIRPSFQNALIYFFSKLLIIITYIKYMVIRKKYTKKDVVFLSSPNNRWEKVDGKYFRPFSNSLQDILKEENIDSIILNISSRILTPVYGETRFILKNIEDICSMYRLVNFFKKKDEIYGWDIFIKFIESKHPELLPFNKRSVVERANKVFFCERIFKKILVEIKPKIGFSVCYYNSITMGYILACRSLGIPSVEIQHSQQELDLMCVSWTRVPNEGYSLLPSRWWSWGSKSAEGINDWSKKIHPEHQALVLGNPWMAQNVDGNYKIDYSDMHKLDDLLKQKINVLVALQPIEPILSPSLLSAISNSPPNVNWLVRLHPAINSRASEIKNQLKTTNNSSIELEYSSKVPLFNILNKVDFLVTSWSGVAYEALLFHVHPIIIHQNGRDSFKEYIDNGLFTYARTGEEILSTLKQNKGGFSYKEETPYIETDKEKMKKIVFDLMKQNENTNTTNNI